MLVGVEGGFWERCIHGSSTTTQAENAIAATTVRMRRGTLSILGAIPP